MLALLLGTLASGSFNLVVRWAQERRGNLLTVGAINYVTAATAYALLSALFSRHVPSPSTVVIGVGGGVAYVTAYLMLLPALQMRGVSIATAVGRLSVLIPVGLSLLLWHEHPALPQKVGILLAAGALPLLGYRPGEAPSEGRRSAALLAGLFLLNGLCGTTLKAFQEWGEPVDRFLMLFLLFATAAAVAVGVCVAKRAPVARRDWAPGVLLGACNICGNLLLLLALHHIPGVIVFPFSSSVGLVYTVLMAHHLWEERLFRVEKTGVVLTTVAVLLLVE